MHRACLDDNDVAELLSGAAPADTRERFERHIDACANCRALVAGVADVPGSEPGVTVPEGAARAGAARGGDEPEAWTPPVRRGERVDHFQVLGLLGRGGMADVYAAYDTKLDRRVALKMVRPNLLGSPEAIARFQREARMTARFSHPSIVAIHAVGEHAGRPYLALEHLEGETLRARLRRQPQPIAEGFRIALAVAEALVEAHRYGILHRDLKPENVHIARDGRVRVLDFGLAKALSANEIGEQASLPDPSRVAADPFETRATSIAGTPSYMAPEQWRGSEISEATDVWALGVILFLIATGRRPFEAESHPELALDVCGGEPAPRLDDPELPAALADLVAACLEKEAAKRPPAAAVAEALRRLLEAVGNEPQPSSAPARRGASDRAPPTSRRTGAILLALAAPLAIAAALFAKYGAQPSAAFPSPSVDGPLPEASAAAPVADPAPTGAASETPPGPSEPERPADEAPASTRAGAVLPRAAPVQAPPKPSSSAPPAASGRGPFDYRE